MPHQTAPHPAPTRTGPLSCSAGNCSRSTCPDCGECVIFCNCPR
jgi:hypothetical protein